MAGRVTTTHTVVIEDPAEMLALMGAGDAVMRELEEVFSEVDFLIRGNTISLTGHEEGVARASDVITELRGVIAAGVELTPQVARAGAGMMSDEASKEPQSRPADTLTRSIVSARGKTIRPKTVGQSAYVEAITSHTITFGIGPAGTGKTYIAMALAVRALQAKEVNRIVLTRPAVEAGERLGFLPGSLSEKIDPYVRPLYDALHDMVDPDSIPRLIEAGTIEVAPLAYMRGRTLNDAFVILDEAQNTTREQMKMFLTRLGFGSTMVVTGDVTQVDLPAGTDSGLSVARELLRSIDGVGVVEFTSDDVVRHRLVSDIIDAYAVDDASTARRSHNGQQRNPARAVGRRD